VTDKPTDKQITPEVFRCPDNVRSPSPTKLSTVIEDLEHVLVCQNVGVRRIASLCKGYAGTRRLYRIQYVPGNCFIERFRAAVNVLVGPCPALPNCIDVRVHNVVLLGK